MFATKLTPEQRLSKAVVDIMANPKYVALAGVMMIGDRYIADDIPTACTNGRDEMYGRAFVDELTDAELRFLILHETYHKLYRHLTTWKHLYDESPQLANMACDYVINCKITDDNTDGFAVMPEIGLMDIKYRGWDSARVYDDLKQKHEEQQQQQDGSGGSGTPQDGNGTPQDGSGMPQDVGMDSHDWEGAQALTGEEQRELARDIDEAIRQGAMAAGKLGTGDNRDLAELLEPQIDWREVLREFITDTCTGSDYSTWARPNRRYRSLGVYLPSGISEQVGELVVAIDTSGSIGSRELSAFLTEVKSICDTVHPSKVRLLYWDTRVCADEEYELHELDGLIASTKPAGGGGTMVECVPEYLRDNGISPQAAIILTDGYLGGSWGTWTCPTLWTILDNRSATSDVGKTVHIKSGDM